MTDLIPPDVLQRLGERTRAAIRERSKRGISSTGEPFPPKEDGTPSTLSESGTLLNDIEVKVEQGRVVIEATAPYAEHVHASRPFLGLTDAEQEEQGRWLEDAVEAHLRGELERVTR